MAKSSKEVGDCVAGAEGLGLSEKTRIIDKKEKVRLLNLQLEEVEMLNAIYYNPGEFILFDTSVVGEISGFVDGKSVKAPPRLDFTINIPVVEGEHKLEICVSLPPGYPIIEPEVFVRSNSLSRYQQHQLNLKLSKYVSSATNGNVFIYSLVIWLQDNADPYFIDRGYKDKKPKETNFKNKNENIKFSRYWIYSHHIYCKMKRRSITDYSKELNITGFCLPGKPGIICIEGLEADCSDWWQRIRSLNWQKIICKKQEEEKVGKDESIDSFRKFTGFEEVVFERATHKSSCHMDMGEFYKYLVKHDCGYIFQEYFGLEGKTSESAN